MAADLSSHDERDMKKKKKLYGRGGRVLQELVERLKYVLPLASSQLPIYYQQKVLAANESEQVFHPYELKLSESEAASRIIDKFQRTHTVVFRYPGNGHYYVALNCQSFSTFSCNLMNAVKDCYLLSAATWQNAFQPFLENCPLPHIVESDEELALLPTTNNVNTAEDIQTE